MRAHYARTIVLSTVGWNLITDKTHQTTHTQPTLLLNSDAIAGGAIAGIDFTQLQPPALAQLHLDLCGNRAYFFVLMCTRVYT